MKMKISIRINRVFWDTDGFSYKSCGIPASLKGEVKDWDLMGEDEDTCIDEAFDLTSDWLSNTYGFCHRGYQGKVVGKTPLPDDAPVDNDYTTTVIEPPF